MGASNNDSYVFISYAHANSDVVLPTVKAMQDSNITLWYDEGIVAGSEWPEFIAEKVVSCTKFVLFVSKAYLQSQNCKRELNFAISRKKEILSIFLEDVELSPGMEMQLGTYQSIYKSRFGSDEFFYTSLCKEPFFNACKGASGGSDKPAASNSSGNTNNYGKDTTSYRPTPPPPPPTYTQGTNATSNPVKPFSYVGGSATANSRTNNGNATGYAYSSLPLKNRYVAAILAFIFGAFGVHKFYLGQKKPGMIIAGAYILAVIILAPLAIAFSIYGIIEGVKIISLSDEAFEQKYSCRTR